MADPESHDPGRLLYSEVIDSIKTSALFAGLALALLLLTWRRVRTAGRGMFANVMGFFGCFFSFYALNYRTLVIRLTPQALRLRFGVFSWVTPIENIERAELDELPALMRYGGAGIHFMIVHGRYRASFNFLEYPRVVIGLRQKAGPVQDISFSTRRPELVLKILHEQMGLADGKEGGETVTTSVSAGV